MENTTLHMMPVGHQKLQQIKTTSRNKSRCSCLVWEIPHRVALNHQASGWLWIFFWDTNSTTDSWNHPSIRWYYCFSIHEFNEEAFSNTHFIRIWVEVAGTTCQQLKAEFFEPMMCINPNPFPTQLWEPKMKPFGFKGWLYKWKKLCFFKPPFLDFQLFVWVS